MSQMLPTQGTSLYQMMSRSIFEKCSDALRHTPTLQTLVVAAAPAVMLFMGGAGLEGYQRIDMQTEGAGLTGHATQAGMAAYREYLASSEALPLLDAIKKGVTGGYETLGTNMTMAGIGAMGAFPALAVAAKAAAHMAEFARSRFGVGSKDRDQPQEFEFTPAPR